MGTRVNSLAAFPEDVMFYHGGKGILGKEILA
jgi:hypothetical protein